MRGVFILRSFKRLKIALVVVAFVCSCSAISACETKDEKRDRYEIVAEYFEDGRLSVDMKASVVIKSDGSNEIKFDMYPNAYRSGASITPLKDGDYCGDLTMKTVELNGKRAEYELTGADENVLSVKADGALKKGEVVTVFIGYESKLSMSDERLSYGAGWANIGNFFPMLCVYKNGEYIECEFGSVGDPFVSEIADYSVSLTVPSKYVVASGLTATGCDVEDSKTMYRYRINSVRDVAFSINEKYSIMEKKWGDRSIKYYFYDDENAENTLNVATAALGYFSEKFGEYPYPSLALAQTRFDAGGMEYPCFCMIADNLPEEDKLFAVVHEIAHQWWYSLVGNDQINSPYLDESLAEYSSFSFFADHGEFGLDAEKIYNETKAGCAYLEHAFLSVYPDYVGAVGRGVYEFRNQFDYVNSVYSKGMLMMKAAEDAVGKKKLMNKLKKYCEKYAYAIADEEGFLDCMGEARPIIESYLGGKVFIPLN